MIGALPLVTLTEVVSSHTSSRFPLDEAENTPTWVMIPQSALGVSKVSAAAKVIVVAELEVDALFQSVVARVLRE